MQIKKILLAMAFIAPLCAIPCHSQETVVDGVAAVVGRNIVK